MTSLPDPLVVLTVDGREVLDPQGVQRNFERLARATNQVAGATTTGSVAVRAMARREYRFVSGSGADSGSNRKNLTLGGGSASLGPAGLAAWNFTQSSIQHHVATDAGLPSGGSPRSVGAIVRTTALNNRWVMGYGTASGEGAFEISANAGSVGDVAIDTYTTNQLIVPSTGINDGDWHAVAAIYDGETLLLSFDGAVVGSATVAVSTTLAGASGLHVGDPVANSTAGKGWIGDIALPFVFPFAADPRDLTIANLAGWA